MMRFGTRSVVLVLVGVLCGCASGSVERQNDLVCANSAQIPTFEKLDADKSGVLTGNELGNNFSPELYANLRCSAVKNQFDADGGGYSKVEYQAWAAKAAPLLCRPNFEPLLQQLMAEHVLCGSTQYTKVLK